MDPQERKHLIAGIKELAESIIISRKKAEDARIKLEKIHARIEEEERGENMANVNEEIQQLS